MPDKPTITHFLDEEEKALVTAIEESNEEYTEDALTPERMAELKSAASATINDERIKISLRLPKSDLQRLKAKALREGMPYQTLINSILHKAATSDNS